MWLYYLKYICKNNKFMLKYSEKKEREKNMQVKDQIMYHYHRMGLHDEIWQVGNEIIIDNLFESNYSGTGVLNFDTTVITDSDKKVSFDRIIELYLKDENIDRETLIRMLNEARRIIINTNIFKRELALEEVRKEFYPSMPSRKHSIWVAGEEQMEFWKTQLAKDKSLKMYKVSLTGTLFKSSDKFIPDDDLTYGESLKDAHNYWNPAFTELEEEEKAEYLFQGKVKILEEIK